MKDKKAPAAAATATVESAATDASQGSADGSYAMTGNSDVAVDAKTTVDSTTEGGTAAAGEVAESDSAATGEVGGEARKRAPAANFLNIVRGRMPLIFVHAIRFSKELREMGKKDVAAKFGTSVGKVFDIQKGRNFEYIGEGFKPSQDDVAAAESWISAMGSANAKGLVAQGDKSLAQSTLDEYKARGLATAADTAAVAAQRTSGRAKAPSTGAAAGQKPALAGTKASPLPVTGEATADALLS